MKYSRTVNLKDGKLISFTCFFISGSKRTACKGKKRRRKSPKIILFKEVAK